MTDLSPKFPRIRMLGLDAMLVQFATSLSKNANRAALSFADHISRADMPLREVAPTLASVQVRFDPCTISHEEMHTILEETLAGRDWYTAPPPANRKKWRIPTLYGGAAGPQLAETAEMTGMSEAQAIEALGCSVVDVLTLGFAPGQPYLGMLDEIWNIPRLTELTASVPSGALTVAIRQFVLFANESPTGWRQVGRTGFTAFDQTATRPALLTPADQVVFAPVSEDEFNDAVRQPFGGARFEVLT